MYKQDPVRCVAAAQLLGAKKKCVWQRVSTEYGIEEISIDNLYNLVRKCNEFFRELRCHISEIRSKIFSLLLYI